MAAKKLLIADDDLKMLKVLTVRLEAEGYEVIISQDAYQALDLARRHQPDLLLLDINMPAGNGFSVQERIGKIKELAGVPVIYMTGEAAGNIDHQARKLGAQAIIHKPFSTDQLLDTIRTALGYWTDEQARERVA